MTIHLKNLRKATDPQPIRIHTHTRTLKKKKKGKKTTKANIRKGTSNKLSQEICSLPLVPKTPSSQTSH